MSWHVFLLKKKILIASRPVQKIFSGFYEFPGGKVSFGEYLLESLHRELKEELDLEINLKKVNFLTNYSIKKRKINLFFFYSTSWKGEIKAMEGQKLRWVKLCEIKNYNLLKSNKKINKIHF